MSTLVGLRQMTFCEMVSMANESMILLFFWLDVSLCLSIEPSSIGWAADIMLLWWSFEIVDALAAKFSVIPSSWGGSRWF